MNSSENEIQDELETLGRAVRTFARFEIQALARKAIYRLQRLPATGVYGVPGFKTLWDEFCYDSQNGPFDDQIVYAWEHTLGEFLGELSGRIPAHLAPLLSNYAAWELDEAVSGDWTEGLKDVIRKQLTIYATHRPLGRFEE